MAETRREVAWASFANERTRLSSHGMVPVVLASETTKLFVEFNDGIPLWLTMEDAAFARPTQIPWGNIASFCWADKPAAKTAAKPKTEAA